MSDALIGCTGFVGGNLARAHRFEANFNSKNIGAIAGREFELLVCAGAPAEKWKANGDPARDRETIRTLAETVGRARVRFAILVSTVDVYPVPRGVDEDHFIVPEDPAYGRHRFLLEKYFQDRFATLVVRLPGLYGEGLKKNAIYDLLHGNQIEKIHCDGVFQFYGLDRLWRDLDAARATGLKTVNLMTEPVSVAEVARAAFGLEFSNRPPGATPARYDVRTKHAAIFGGQGGYLEDKETVLAGIKAFVARERAKRAG